MEFPDGVQVTKKYYNTGSRYFAETPFNIYFLSGGYLFHKQNCSQAVVG